MNKIRKGDQVVVVCGKDKGKRGVVLRVLPEEGRAVVEGVNLVKRHTKPNPMKGLVGGIVELSLPIHLSNLAIFNPATGKADRVGFRVLDDARKVRIFRSNSEVIDV